MASALGIEGQFFTGLNRSRSSEMRGLPPELVIHETYVAFFPQVFSL